MKIFRALLPIVAGLLPFGVVYLFYHYQAPLYFALVFGLLLGAILGWLLFNEDRQKTQSAQRVLFTRISGFLGLFLFVVFIVSISTHHRVYTLVDYLEYFGQIYISITWMLRAFLCFVYPRIMRKPAENGA